MKGVEKKRRNNFFLLVTSGCQKQRQLGGATLFAYIRENQLLQAIGN